MNDVGSFLPRAALERLARYVDAQASVIRRFLLG